MAGAENDANRQDDALVSLIPIVVVFIKPSDETMFIRQIKLC
mgnify:CR=1 FL=1